MLAGLRKLTRTATPQHLRRASSSSAPQKPAEALLVKPEEPGPEDCCQTGCVECVWEVYTRDMQKYNIELAKRKGEKPPVDPLAELEARLYGKSG